MVIEYLERELRAILCEELFAGIGDVDAYLDARDEAVFDGEWIRTYEEIEVRKEGCHISFKLLKQVDSLRKKAFMIAYEISANSELSETISDDFGLIGDALLLSYRSDWICAFFQSYLAGELPYGELLPAMFTEKTLSELLKEFHNSRESSWEE